MDFFGKVGDKWTLLREPGKTTSSLQEIRMLGREKKRGQRRRFHTPTSIHLQYIRNSGEYNFFSEKFIKFVKKGGVFRFSEVKRAHEPKEIKVDPGAMFGFLERSIVKTSRLVYNSSHIS